MKVAVSYHKLYRLNKNKGSKWVKKILLHQYQPELLIQGWDGSMLSCCDYYQSSNVQYWCTSVSYSISWLFFADRGSTLWAHLL